MSLQMRALDLRLLLDEEIAHFATRAASSEVELELTGPSAIHVSGDELRLRQVIGNLLDNAIRHSPAGSTVRVRAAATPESVTVGVADEGDGLPSNSSDLFTPFWRADEGRARDGGGVGLGLSIARAIIEAHGGSIEAESRTEGGSIFRFTLPR
jgi:two-component system OmpR family sensor kinase